MDWKLTRNLCGEPEVDQIHQTQAEEDVRLGLALMRDMTREYDEEIAASADAEYSPLKYLSMQPHSGLTEVEPGVYVAE